MTTNVSRLKVARVAAGFNQFDLAQRVKVNEVTISRVETGRITPSADLKARISQVLGKPSFELFDR